ncbi:MAG: hypothetical protein ACI857_001472 [Arenicella sp.]|jgi:hypothetical protein
MKVYYLLLLLFFGANSIAQHGDCLHFDGTNDYVTMGDVNNLGTSDFTIETWLYLEGTPNVADKIVNKGLTTVGTPVNAGYAIRTRRNAPDELEFTIGDASGTIANLYYHGITTNQWYHVAAVRRATYLYLYLDGVLVVQETTPFVFNVDTDMPFAVGAIDKGGLSFVGEKTRGKIDEVRVWNMARSQQDIQENMNCKMAAPQTNLLALYNLDETSGTVASDATVNSSNGTLIGVPVWESSQVAPFCTVSFGPEPEVENFSFKIYANPVTDILRCNVMSGEYSITNLNGKIVKRGQVYSGEIDVEALKTGMYMLQLSNGEVTYMSKFMHE